MITDPKNIYFNRKTAKAATTKHLDRRRHWFLSSLAFLLYFVIVVVSTTTKTTYPLRRSSLSSNLGRILRTLPSKQGLVTTNRWYNHRQERRRVPQEQRDQQRVQHPRKSVHQDLLQINSDSTDPARTKIDSILDKYCNKGTRPLLRLRGGAGNDDDDNSGDINGTMAGKDTNQNAPANSTTTMDPAAVTTTATNTDTNTTEKSISTLSKIRQTLFPIESNEAKKFLLIGSIKFFIILALTLTRDTKDTLVVTQCGAEAIAFLKVRYVLFVFVKEGNPQTKNKSFTKENDDTDKKLSFYFLLFQDDILSLTRLQNLCCHYISITPLFRSYFFSPLSLPCVFYLFFSFRKIK